MKRYLLAFVLGGIVLSAGIAYATVSQTITLPTVGQLLYSASGNTGGVATSSTGTASTIVALDANGKTAFTSATTTNLSVNSTNVVGSGSAADYITTTHGFTVTYATSTAWTGSTTALFIMTAPFSISLKQAICFTDAGTLNVQFQYGTGPTLPAMLTASSTNGTQTFTTNTTPAKGNTIQVKFGTPASSPTEVNCTGTWTQTGV